MKVYTNLNEVPVFNKAVLTIGTFDGVHLGHVKVIGQLISEANNAGGTPVLVTFHPHPKQIVANTKNRIYMLNTREEKYRLLQNQGIEHVVEVPFNESFANQLPEAYIENFLVKNFNPGIIIIGYDHRFGKGRTGDIKLLEQYAPKFGYSVKEISEKLIDNIIISSTKIRDALLDADLVTAKEFLGYDYFFTGTVVKGNQLGRTIGYPTANLTINDEEKLVPGNGVYAVDVVAGNRKLKGMMNIGNRPTVNGNAPVKEVHIFDFNEDIYNEQLTVFFKMHLRSEKKFGSLEELKKQLVNDEAVARKLNA